MRHLSLGTTQGGPASHSFNPPSSSGTLNVPTVRTTSTVQSAPATSVPTTLPRPSVSFLPSPSALVTFGARPNLNSNASSEEKRQDSILRNRPMGAKPPKKKVGGRYNHHPFPGPSSFKVPSASPVLSGIRFLIALLPLTYDEKYFDNLYRPSVPLLRDTAQVRKIVDGLKDFKLCFTITITAPADDPVAFWCAFHQQVEDSVANGYRALPPCPELLDDNHMAEIRFEQVPFHLMTLSRKNNDGRYKLQPCHQLVYYDLLTTLQKASLNWRNPEGADPPVVNFLASRFGNMSGSIALLLDVDEVCDTCSYLRHGCFGFRLLSKLGFADAIAVNPEIGEDDQSASRCRPDICPPCTSCGRGEVKNVQVPMFTNSLVRRRSSTPPMDNSDKRDAVDPEGGWYANWSLENSVEDMFASPELPVAPLVAEPSKFPLPLPPDHTIATTKPTSERPVSIPVQADRTKSPTPEGPRIEFDPPSLPDPKAVHDVQMAFRGAIGDLAERAHVSGDSVDDAATKLLSALRSKVAASAAMSGQSTQSAIKVDDGDVRLPSIVSLIHEIGIFAIGDKSVGDGPRVAVYASACRLMLQNNHYWSPPSEKGYCVPCFLNGRSTPERLNQWETFGALLAVLLSWVPATMVSPFLIMALFSHNNQLDVPLEIIAVFNHDLAVIVSPWLRRKPGSKIDILSDVSTFLIDHMDMQAGVVSDIEKGLAHGITSDSEKKHILEEYFAELTTTFLTRLIFKQGELWKNDEFQALYRGFNLSLSSSETVVSIFHCHAPTNLDVARLVAAMYNNVSSPHDLISRFTMRDGRPTEKRSLQKQMFDVVFRHRVERYLQGQGNPLSESGSDMDDPLLRTKALLKVMTSFDLLPVNPKWRLHVHANLTATQRFNVTCAQFVFSDLSPSDRCGEEPHLIIHTCFDTIDVVMNKGLQSIILQPRQDFFDKWFHWVLTSSDEFNVL
ncbi:hypothetical protein K474DRAFT_1706023 [Panus rudis PR-1116 ss-1]|nr:hypothetical protein K474DRAFT_1706023 [Panus rudis PR-1116 ss-1]